MDLLLNGVINIRTKFPNKPNREKFFTWFTKITHILELLITQKSVLNWWENVSILWNRVFSPRGES